MATTRQVKLPDLQLGTEKADKLGVRCYFFALLVRLANPHIDQVAIHNELVARGFTVGEGILVHQECL